MTALFAPSSSVVEVCRAGLQLGIGLLLQSGLLLAAGLLAGRLLHPRGPALESLVYRAALLAVAVSVLLVPLLAGSYRPFWSLSLPSTRTTAATQPENPRVLDSGFWSRNWPGKVRSVQSVSVRSTRSAQSAQPSEPLPPIQNPKSKIQNPMARPRAGDLGLLYAAAASLWCGGTVLLLAGLALCQLWIRRLGHGSEPVQDGAAAALAELCGALRLRPPLLLESDRVRSPFLTGLWRPAILFPAGYEREFDGPALRAILIHEVTHLQRRDCAWNLLARVSCALLWVQPLLWVLCRRLEHASEEVCDQAVVQGEVSPCAYADCLLRLAERLLPSRPERAAGVGVVPFRSSLGRRVERIMDGSRRRSLHLTLRQRAGTAAAAAFIAGMGLSLVSAAPRPAPAAKTKRPVNAAQQPSGGPVSGRVLLPDGRPAPGATVSWITNGDDGPAVLTSVETDAAGRFLFAEAARLRHPHDFPQLLAQAAAGGLAIQNVPESRQPVEIALHPPTELRVTFLGPDGKPVPNLKVVPQLVAREHEFIFFPKALQQNLTQQTDAGGAVAFAGLPQGWRARLDVEDERFAHLSYRSMLDLGRGPVTEAPSVHLEPGASIWGRITFGPTGRPAAGVKVGAQGMGPVEGWSDAVTDADGVYRLTQLGPGAYNVALDLRGDLARSWTARAHEGVSLRTGEQQEGVDFQLIHGAVITGKVMAADNGQPLAGLAIGVYGPAHPQSGAWVQRAVAGPDGIYLQRVPAGKQHLYFQDLPPPGFLKPARVSYDLTVKEGDTITVDFKLPRGARVQPVHGRVLGPDGKPVANAEVAVSSAGQFGSDTILHTDANGAFTLSEQLLSNAVTLRARQGDLATPTGTVVTGSRPVTLHLRPHVLASLSGRVTDPAGHPIPEAEVSPAAWAYDTGRGTGMMHVDAQGRYVLSALWPDLTYTVNATAPGFGQKWTDHVHLRPGESRELSPLVLEVADRSVAGRVVNEAGDPVIGAQVNLDGRESAPQMKATDGEGRFRFDVVNEQVSVQAWSTGYQWARKRVPAGSTDVILVLTKEKDTSSAGAAEPKEQFDALQGQPAPELRAAAWLNSPPRNLRQLRGKVVLIDFWGIGCGPCVAALPGVQRAAEQFAARGVVVIGLHAAGCKPAELRQFAHAHHLTYPLAIDTPDVPNLSFGKTFREYTVVGIPSVAVIDRTGRVAYLGHSLDEAVGSLSPLLARGVLPGSRKSG